jgi:hypothetical protein
MKSTSEAGILSIRIHGAQLKSPVPSYLEAYKCSFNRPLSELTSVKNKLSDLVDTGIQVPRNSFAR